MKPPDRRFILYLVLLAVVLIIAWMGLRLAFAQTPHTEPTVSIERAFYFQPNIVYFPDYQVLGTEVDETLYNIIRCESNFRPEVCSYAGCQAGMGLAQLIPGTVKYCEEKLGREINPFNPTDNLDCAIWLLENEGTRHWQPSRHCWDK